MTADLDPSAPLADPGMRLAARLIDDMALFLPSLLGVLVAVAVGSATLMTVAFAVPLLLAPVLMVLNLVWLHRDGQTLGKRWTGLRIVRSDGSRASLRRIVAVRIVLVWILGAVPFLGWLFVLVDSLMVFTSDRRCLHDHLAGTMVIDLRRSPGE